MSDLITNKTSLKRPRALTESESVMRKNLNNKRTVPGALSEILGFLLRMYPDSASLGFAVPLWWYGKV
jgi:hypothetical protein